MSNTYQLYGIPCSLWMGKARSYLRKQHIPFIERGVSDPHYQKNIMPAIGRLIMPVLESPHGKIVQDGSDIIDFFEQQDNTRLSAYPTTPLHSAVSALFELFGGEYLLRPAMHYRWNFDDANLAFIKDEFIAGIAPNAEQEAADQLFDFASAKMRQAATLFGVNDYNHAIVEASYLEFLDLFSAHLTTSAYLLGGAPTIGDYGLIAPLFAHLDRDPYPALIMRQKAPRVHRWVERMNSAEQVATEHGSSEALFANDQIPQTLKQLMRYFATESLGEISAHISFANQWLGDNPTLETGTNGTKDPSNRVLGMSTFDWRGTTLTTAVFPYRFYLLQKFQDIFDQATAPEQQAITELLNETGLAELITLRTKRRVERKNHQEVWGPLRR